MSTVRRQLKFMYHFNHNVKNCWFVFSSLETNQFSDYAHRTIHYTDKKQQVLKNNLTFLKNKKWVFLVTDPFQNKEWNEFLIRFTRRKGNPIRSPSKCISLLIVITYLVNVCLKRYYSFTRWIPNILYTLKVTSVETSNYVYFITLLKV